MAESGAIQQDLVSMEPVQTHGGDAAISWDQLDSVAPIGSGDATVQHIEQKEESKPRTVKKSKEKEVVEDGVTQEETEEKEESSQEESSSEASEETDEPKTVEQVLSKVKRLT